MSNRSILYLARERLMVRHEYKGGKNSVEGRSKYVPRSRYHSYIVLLEDAKMTRLLSTKINLFNFQLLIYLLILHFVRSRPTKLLCISMRSNVRIKPLRQHYKAILLEIVSRLDIVVIVTEFSPKFSLSSQIRMHTIQRFNQAAA